MKEDVAGVALKEKGKRGNAKDSRFPLHDRVGVDALKGDPRASRGPTSDGTI